MSKALTRTDFNFPGQKSAKADSAGVFFTEFSILLFTRVCNHVFTRRNFQ